MVRAAAGQDMVRGNIEKFFKVRMTWV